MNGLRVEETELKIEDNIPVPEGRRGRAVDAEIKQVLDDLKVHQSVFIPLGYQGKTDEKRLRNYAVNCAASARRREGNKEKAYFSTVVEGGARIWRTK